MTETDQIIQRAYRHTAALRWVVRFFSFLMCVIIGGVFGALGMQFTEPPPGFPGEALDTVSSKLLSYQKGYLNLFEDRERRGSCKAITQRWIWNFVTMNNGETLPAFLGLDGSSAPILAPGEHLRYILKLKQPDNLTDGTWTYRAHTYQECPVLMGLLTRVVESQTRDVQFQIQDGKIVQNDNGLNGVTPTQFGRMHTFGGESEEARR